MARHGNNIVMVKRQTTKKVSVLSGRVFTARFKRVKHSDLPTNMRIRRTYRGNPVQGGLARINLVKGRRFRGRGNQ